MFYKLSPSDFPYLYEECKFCFCLKVKHGISQPHMPMPGVFSAINSHIQGSLVGKNLKGLSSDLPDGVVENQEGWIDSMIVPETSVFIKGKYDLLVNNPDGTHTLVDLKISQPDESKIEKYKTQLAAYKFALENPAFGEPKKVSKMGVIAINPEEITFPGETVIFKAKPQWFEIAEDMDRFYAFISEISKLIEGPVPPENPDICKWCYYRICTQKPENSAQELPF